MSVQGATDFLKTVDSLDDVFIKAGAAAGFDFTVNDLQKAAEEMGSLSDAELKQVAGGRAKHPHLRDVIKSMLGIGVEVTKDRCRIEGPGSFP